MDGKLAPYHAVQLGGRVTEGKTRFGVNVGAVPARNAPALIRDFLSAWQRSSESDDFHRFVEVNGKTVASELIEQHQQAPFSKQKEEFFVDWDSDAAFSIAGRGAGEYSAS